MAGTAAWAGFDLTGWCFGLWLEHSATVSVQHTGRWHLFITPDVAEHGSVQHAVSNDHAQCISADALSRAAVL